MKGFFITLEGVDGCGKSTAARLLGEYLQQHGRKVLLTREPGGSQLGRELRRLLLTAGNLQPQAQEEALLFAADRAAHVRQVIAPALAKGQIVICDRYTDSTLAYQGGGRGLALDFLHQLNQFASGGLVPDLTFWLSLPLEIARKRQGKNHDRLEREDAEFFARVSEVYRRLAEQEPARMRVIDTDRPTQEVLAALVAQLPKEWGGAA